MRIVGFNFEEISAKRKKPVSGKLEVKSNLEIADIEKADLELLKKENAIKFSFDFIISYEPGFAELNFKGFVLTMVDDKQAKQVIKSWKKKKLDDKIRIPLFNLILTKCNIKALQFEEEFGLPTHIPFPKVTAEQEKK